MRVVAGGLVFVTGLAGLGWYASQGPAEQMENDVRGAAAAVADTAQHDVDVTVSGRDIQVTGTVEDAAERDRLFADFDALPGRRVVNMDAVALLPVQAPYTATLEKTDAGLSVAGYAPSAAARDALGYEDLVIANGEPETGWSEALTTAAGALETLKSGSATLNDTTLTVTGLAADPDAQVAFDAAIAALPEGYSAESAITLEDDGTPLRLALQYDGATLVGSGKIPADLPVAEIALPDSDATLDLQEAALPSADGMWPGFATQAMAALGQLRSGDLNLTGQSGTLTGTGSPDQIAAAEAALAALPEGYAVETALDVYDDGTPLRLNLTYDGTTLAGTGKIPTDLPLAEVTVAGATTDLDLQEANIPSEDGAWPVFASAAVAAMGEMTSGEMALEGQSVVFNGTGTPDGIAAAEDILADLPDGYMAITDFTVFDDGTPFRLQVEKTSDGLVASGKVPADFGVELDGVETAFVADESGLWPGVGQAGLDALDKLQTGTLTVDADGVTLTGVAFSQAEEAAALDALSGVDATTDLSISEEGRARPFAVTFASESGVALSGSQPAGLSTADVSDALSLPVSDDDLAAIPLETDADVLGQLANLQPLLPEMQSFTLTEDGTQATLDVVAAPGVAPDRLAAAITGAIGDSAALSVTAPDNLPEDGTLRRNLFTGQDEIFTAGYWLPSFDFFPTPESCTAQSDEVLARDQVRFLSGSAELDVQSIRAINALSALARKCAVEGGVFVQVAGHTDNTGDADANLALSQARADAVRDAMLDRGLAQVVVSAVGYGDTQPIADNATEEGRAANRRTEFNWTFE